MRFEIIFNYITYFKTLYYLNYSNYGWKDICNKSPHICTFGHARNQVLFLLCKWIISCYLDYVFQQSFIWKSNELTDPWQSFAVKHCNMTFSANSSIHDNCFGVVFSNFTDYRGISSKKVFSHAVQCFNINFIVCI